jgi:hypothetical protein
MSAPQVHPIPTVHTRTPIPPPSITNALWNSTDRQMCNRSRWVVDDVWSIPECCYPKTCGMQYISLQYGNLVCRVIRVRLHCDNIILVTLIGKCGIPPYLCVQVLVGFLVADVASICTRIPCKFIKALGCFCVMSARPSACIQNSVCVRVTWLFVTLTSEVLMGDTFKTV